MRIAQRARRIAPFYVMEVAKAASEIARTSANSATPMIFLNIGEPDFTAPPLVQEAAARAVRDGKSQYTDAIGLPALRERISAWYGQRFALQVPASRIVITSGASAALQLACLALIEAGDEILMPDPSYPCNRNFVSAAEGTAVLIPCSGQERFQLSADKVQQAWGRKTRGVMLASPSNPTGTSIEPGELQGIHAIVQAHDGITLVDEIYLGLSHDPRYAQTALAYDDQLISINSFSKYFNMTGWR
ncbi:MAG: aminotransferase class I/II-fold pyridoxal phosphate-dependent enzyme, partial [Hylemonella sp.]